MTCSGVIYIVVTMLIYRATSNCVFDSFDVDNPPLFTIRNYDQETTKELIILKPHEKSITINNGGQIEAYCPYNLLSTDKSTQLEIQCRMHKILYVVKSGAETQRIESELPRLGCLQTVSVYKATSEYCDDVSMYVSMAYAIKGTFGPKLLSDICYDIRSMETHMIHYRTKPTGEELREYFYPGVDISSDERELQVDFILNTLDREQEFNESYGKFRPNGFEAQSFRFDELVPSENFHIAYRFGLHHRALNSMLWSAALKGGNWRYIEELTKEFVQTGEYDIYTGALYSNDKDSTFGRDALYYRSRYGKQRIPLYVWKYVKAVHPSDAKNEVVIIGINNPYLQASDINKFVFCHDICDSVFWLAELEVIRKYMAFGYVFCCNAYEAGQNIPMIEKIRYAFRNTYIIHE